MKRIANDTVVAIMDIVADFYSKPQMGGALKAGSRRGDSYTKFSIPVIKGSHVGSVAGGVAEAVKLAGGAAIKSFARENPKPDQKRKMHAGANKFRESFSQSASGMISKALGVVADGDDKPSASKKKKSAKKKHKRKSKIITFLGDESF
jgi:hypothetical protein